jgi:hypothetical protein
MSFRIKYGNPINGIIYCEITYMYNDDYLDDTFTIYIYENETINIISSKTCCCVVCDIILIKTKCVVDTIELIKCKYCDKRKSINLI